MRWGPPPALSSNRSPLGGRRPCRSPFFATSAAHLSILPLLARLTPFPALAQPRPFLQPCPPGLRRQIDRSKTVGFALRLHHTSGASRGFILRSWKNKRPTVAVRILGRSLWHRRRPTTAPHSRASPTRPHTPDVLGSCRPASGMLARDDAGLQGVVRVPAARVHAGEKARLDAGQRRKLLAAQIRQSAQWDQTSGRAAGPPRLSRASFSSAAAADSSPPPAGRSCVRGPARPHRPSGSGCQHKSANRRSPSRPGRSSRTSA